MKRSRLRRAFFAPALALAVIAGWYWFAPASVGGSTTYVATSGISMEPRFHTGDLALVRPESAYRVGEIVAYRSSLLHVVVLHRIIGREGDRYVFKGDNNNFIDPIHPTRSALVGALWLRVPHGGVVLRIIQTPVMAATIIAIVGLLVVFSAAETRQRRRRRRQAPGSGMPKRSATPQPEHATKRRPQPAAATTPRPEPGAPPPPAQGLGRLLPHDPRLPLVGVAGTAALLLIVGLVAFATSASKTVNQPIAYTQSVQFSYEAAVAPGPVYPDGRIHTGQPIFLHLVRHVHVAADYRLATGAGHQVGGVAQLMLVITGPTGWSRTFPLTGPMRFEGPHIRAGATLDLPWVQGLLGEVQRLTGMSADGGDSIAALFKVALNGTVAGRSLSLAFSPSLSFGLGAVQLQPGGGTAGSDSSDGLRQSKSGAVPGFTTEPNHLHVLGAALAVGPLRWLSVLGFLLATSAAAFLFVVMRLRAPFAEIERIRARYGHLIVPVVAAPDALEHVPFDVTDIEALVRLAQSGERLILHHRDPLGDVFLVADDSSVFRYRPGPTKVVWGEWSTPRLDGNGHHPAGPENRSTVEPEAAAADGDGHASARPAAAAQSVATPPVGVPLSAFEAASRKRRSTAQLGLAALGLLVGLRRPAR